MSKPDNPYINSLPGEEMGDLNASKGWRPPVPATGRDRGAGPFKRLVLRGATIIDGTGAPPWGPVDVVIEKIGRAHV